ncbi:type I glyceraldehyde-3-phosphate dehydrogenase [Patescibacteria group bacterium]|nr:type I glyceraldehyde-3-phosphate dehydrogenase [Patescibacteria group bacterium]MBU4482145.1 type I glyceraldehyde-3-phosphate dehydrogenase [Patescibacteria group bacterium]
MSKKINVAINGFGRIGRSAFKIAFEKNNIEIVAINDLTDNATLAHLLKYDSVYGIYDKDIKYTDKGLVVNKKHIAVFSQKEIQKLPWKKLNVDVVLECTGVFREYEDIKKHLKAGAKKVILSATPKSKEIKTYVIGVNENQYKPEEKIVSCASCTTNCYAPITKILHNKFGVERGFMVTAHAVTTDQRILDLPHKDLRRARTVLDNIIPTSSNSDKAIGEIIPELKGKIHTMAMRVPVRVGSVIYAIYDLKKKPSPEAVNNLMKRASRTNYKNIIKYETEPIVSADIVNTTYSAIFDSLLTQYSDDLIKIVAWYDNEWAYSNRLVEMIQMVIPNDF